MFHRLSFLCCILYICSSVSFSLLTLSKVVPNFLFKASIEIVILFIFSWSFLLSFKIPVGICTLFPFSCFCSLFYMFSSIFILCYVCDNYKVWSPWQSNSAVWCFFGLSFMKAHFLVGCVTLELIFGFLKILGILRGLKWGYITLEGI